MSTFSGRASGRGMSVLSALVFVGLLGFVGLALQSAQPSNSLLAQGASQLAAVDSATTPTPAPAPALDATGDYVTPDPQQKAIRDDLKDNGKENCSGAGGVWETPVNFACYQTGSVSDIDSLQQTCSKGFKYVITESEGSVTVTPKPLALNPPTGCPTVQANACSSGGKEVVSYSDATCTVLYCASGEISGTEDQVCSAVTDPGIINLDSIGEARKNAVKKLAENLGLSGTREEEFINQNFGALRNQNLGDVYTEHVKAVEAKQVEVNKAQDLLNNLRAEQAVDTTGDYKDEIEKAKINLAKLQEEFVTLQSQEVVNDAPKPADPVPPGSGEKTPAGGTTFNPPPASSNGSSSGGGDSSALSALMGLLKGMMGGGGGGSGGGGSGGGSSSSGGQQQPQQCQNQPAQPAASSCSNGYWSAIYTNGCVTSWQCIQSGGTSSIATLTCTPSVADVGMKVAAAYSCSSGTPKSDSFAIESDGTTEFTVSEPASGLTTATYSFSCMNSSGGVAAVASCAVEINKPKIVFVANPQTVLSNATSLLGWVTSGIGSCVISSPDDADFTARNANNSSANGTATTSAITADTRFVLTCLTYGGSTKVASTTVKLATGEDGNGVTVLSSVDGSTLNHLDAVEITWQSTGLSSDSRIALQLLKVDDPDFLRLIASAQAQSGSYTWNVPGIHSDCPTDGSFNVCGADLTPGVEYYIEAVAYTPSDAYVGDGPTPTGAVGAVYGDSGNTAAFIVGI